METKLLTTDEAVGVVLFALILTVLLSVGFGLLIARELKKDKEKWQQEKKG